MAAAWGGSRCGTGLHATVWGRGADYGDRVQGYLPHVRRRGAGESAEECGAGLARGRVGVDCVGGCERKEPGVEIPVQKGEKLYFVVNCNLDAVDDDTVWNPQITYERLDGAWNVRSGISSMTRARGCTILVAGASARRAPQRDRLSGRKDLGDAVGKREVRDKVSYKFRGTGIEVLGDTGSDHGMADLSLDREAGGRK